MLYDVPVTYLVFFPKQDPTTEHHRSNIGTGFLTKHQKDTEQ
jgi:hypothetical protein